MHDHILQMLEDGANLDVVYLDFKNTFHKVDHTILLRMVPKLGIVGRIGRWKNAFLIDRV